MRIPTVGMCSNESGIDTSRMFIYCLDDLTDREPPGRSRSFPDLRHDVERDDGHSVRGRGCRERDLEVGAARRWDVADDPPQGFPDRSARAVEGGDAEADGGDPEAGVV